nr:hypothetical protein [Tanacetum cinerariifolium]
MLVHIIVKDTRTMDMTIDQQVALDEALVPHSSRLRIGKSNFCLRSDITSKESTLQLVTATVHHHSIWFKMDNRKRIVNLEYFREMLHICPRLPGQTFDELLFEEEILAFLRFLRHSGEIRKLTDVNINKLHQPWRSFTAKNVDFAYLLWEDFVYQVEHKDAKKSNEMYYPRFTKVIIHYFMTKDPSIPRRNKVNWHYVRDDQMFTTIKLVSRHQNTQQFGVMLPVELTDQDIRNSKAYKEYYAVALGAAPPKTKESVRKTKSSSDTTITPPTAVGTRLSTSAKGKQPAKSSKAKGLTVLSEVAMTEAEQMKLATKRSLQQTYISQASGSGADERAGIIPWVLDVPNEESDEEISWKSSNEDDDDDDEVDERSDDQYDDDDQDDDDQDEGDDNDQDTDNDGDEFVHTKLSIHEEEETKDEESFDPIVQTPDNSDDKGNDDASLGLNVGSKEGQDAKDDDDELYRAVNINLEGRDVQMTDVHTIQEFEDTHVTLTPVNPDADYTTAGITTTSTAAVTPLRSRHHPTVHATTATTAATAAAFPAVAGCGRQHGRHRRVMSKKGLSVAAPPLWWRSDDGTPPQPHLVVSGCDGATHCGTTGWSILTDSQVTPTKPGQMTKPCSSHRFIANYFNAGHLKMKVKAFKLSNQERYEHAGPKSLVHKVEKITGWRKEIMIG